MIGPHLDQRLPGQVAALNQLFRIGKRNDIVEPAVQDYGSGLDRPDLTELLPGWTQEHQSNIADSDVHGDGAAPARTNDDFGPLSIELGLGDSHCTLKIFIRKLRVEDRVTIFTQEGWLDAAGDRLPTVKEQNLHAWILPRVSLRSTRG